MQFDPSRPIPPEQDAARSASRLIGVAFSCAMLALALVGEGDVGAIGALGAVAASGLCGATLGWLVWRRCIAVATILVAFGLAYIPGASSGMTSGFASALLPVTAESVRLAFAIAIGFAVGTSLVAGAVEIRIAKWLSARSLERQAPRLDPNLVTYTLAGLTFAAAISAFKSGTWTYYGAGDTGLTADFRLDYLYQPLLGAAYLVAVQRLSTPSKSTRVHSLGWAGVLATCVLLLFLLQSRRMMLGCITLGALTYLASGIDTQRWRPPAGPGVGRRLVVLAAASITAAGMLYGSYFWRIASEERPGGAPAELIQSAADHAMGGGGAASAVVQSTQDRLSYLWNDAAALQYSYDAPFLSFGTLLVSQGGMAVPGLIFPGKYDLPTMTCETGFAHLGLDMDLGCTPTNEALMFGGWPALLVVCALWILGLLAAGTLMRMKGDLTTALSFVWLHPYLYIETSALPQAMALRNMLIVYGLMVPLPLIVDLMRRRPSRQLARKLGAGDDTEPTVATPGQNQGPRRP